MLLGRNKNKRLKMMIDIYSSPNFETEFEPEVIERGKKVKLVSINKALHCIAL